MTRWSVALAVGLASHAGGSPPERPREPHDFFRTRIGLSEPDIAAIERGKAVAVVLETASKPEVLIFGAVYVDAPVQAYLTLFRDVSRLENTPGYLAARRLSEPPGLADFEGFTLDAEEVADLQDCKVGECAFQIPAWTIEEFRAGIDWKAPDGAARVNRRVRELALAALIAYRTGGLEALGEYQDKREPTRAAEHFETLLGRNRALPEYLPEFHRYLLEYPKATLEGAEDYFTWERVDFGLKPTLRLNHVTIWKVSHAARSPYAFAIKQLYASHYFQTAVDLSFCWPASAGPARQGFYLLTLKGSRQDGLTGLKGSVTRKVVVGKTRSAMEEALDHVRAALEAGPAP